MRILLLLAMSCVMGLSLPSESQGFGRRTRNTFTPVPMCVCPEATDSAGDGSPDFVIVLGESSVVVPAWSDIP